MQVEQYWKSNTARPERQRVHIDRDGGITVCGRIAGEEDLIKVSRIEMQRQQIPTCSRCVSILKSNSYGNEDISKYNQTKLGRVDKMPGYKKTSKSKTRKSKSIQLPEKFKDEIANPQLKKFKSIINSAKEKKVAIQNAIQETMNYDEDIKSNIEALTDMLPDTKRKLTLATSDEYNAWEEDHNTANDCKHFCNITALRNLLQAIETVENL